MKQSIKDIAKALRERDGLSYDESLEEARSIRKDIKLEMSKSGATLADIEERMYEYGLEPDYAFTIIAEDCP